MKPNIKNSLETGSPQTRGTKSPCCEIHSAHHHIKGSDKSCMKGNFHLTQSTPPKPFSCHHFWSSSGGRLGTQRQSVTSGTSPYLWPVPHCTAGSSHKPSLPSSGTPPSLEVSGGTFTSGNQGPPSLAPFKISSPRDFQLLRKVILFPTSVLCVLGHISFECG